MQALVLLNDPIYVEAARTLAERLMTESDGSTSERLEKAVQLVLSRPATGRELQALLDLYDGHVHRPLQADASPAAESPATGEVSVADGLDENQLDAWTAVTRVLLNLHETITRY